VSARPKDPWSWYAVGGYYYAEGKWEMAQRMFAKATRLDGRSVER